MASKQLDDEKERKRKLSNREAARRSRMRKQQRLDELNDQLKQIQEENKKVREMIDDASLKHTSVESENNVLRAQVSELSDRLGSLNSVLEIASMMSDIPDSLLEPWRLPCPINTSAADHMFRC